MASEITGNGEIDLDAFTSYVWVRVPLPAGGELRKLLFHRADLDRLIEVWKNR